MLVVLIGVEVSLDLTVRDHLERQLHQQLGHEAAVVAEALAGRPSTSDELDALADRMGAALDSRVTVIEADGRVTGDSDVALDALPQVENHATRPEVIAARASGTGTAIRDSATVGTRMVYVAKKTEGGRVVRVAKSTAKADVAARSARLAVYGTGLIAALLAVVLAATVSSALARPIRDVTDAARAMASGDLTRRIALRRRDEVGEVAVALNDLAASFEHTITERTRLEHVRTDFVANASHELKTPVAAILAASETLSGGAADDPIASRRFLDVIGRHASRLAALVDDLLDLSRLEARPADAMREVHAADALSRATTAFGESAAAKRIELRVATEARDLPGVRGDPALMDRALTNLVQNAVRYTPEGGRVILRASRVDDGVRFEVEDTGIGIPPHALSRIFERFYRVDPARSRELGGTGLGLAIVKHAVESMGGTVAVHSVLHQGSTFSFTLPVWPAKTPS